MARELRCKPIAILTGRLATRSAFSSTQTRTTRKFFPHTTSAARNVSHARTRVLGRGWGALAARGLRCLRVCGPRGRLLCPCPAHRVRCDRLARPQATAAFTLAWAQSCLAARCNGSFELSRGRQVSRWHSARPPGIFSHPLRPLHGPLPPFACRAPTSTCTLCNISQGKQQPAAGHCGSRTRQGPATRAAALSLAPGRGSCSQSAAAPAAVPQAAAARSGLQQSEQMQFSRSSGYVGAAC